jgi:hypothetical protein
MRTALITAIPLLSLLCAHAADAGPWPRAHGDGFAALTPQIGMDAGDDAFGVAGFSEIHAEYGATPDWTLGVDAYQSGDQGDDWTGIAFARRHVWSSAGGDVISAELGLGYLTTPDDGQQARLRPGVSWGRGFGAAWGAGWMSVDASAEFQSSEGDPALKADFTAGVRTQSGMMLIMQLQTDRQADGGVSARLAPSAVLSLSDGVQMQLSVAAGVVNDTSASVKLGTWLAF